MAWGELWGRGGVGGGEMGGSGRWEEVNLGGKTVGSVENESDGRGILL